MKMFFALMLMLPLLGCSYLEEIDSPSIGPEDEWIKDGFSKSEIKHNLVLCGLNEKTWNMSQQEMVDLCMLRNGFVFIETPYKHHGRFCDDERFKNLPSCRSLKK